MIAKEDRLQLNVPFRDLRRGWCMVEGTLVLESGRLWLQPLLWCWQSFLSWSQFCRLKSGDNTYPTKFLEVNETRSVKQFQYLTLCELSVPPPHPVTQTGYSRPGVGKLPVNGQRVIFVTKIFLTRKFGKKCTWPNFYIRVNPDYTQMLWRGDV